MSLIIPVTPPGIVPRTVRLLMQLPNHYATPEHIYKNNFSYVLSVNRNNCNFEVIVIYYEQMMFSGKITRPLHIRL